MLSAAALAAVRIGIVCTRPMQTPTTNISAVVVLAIEPSAVLLSAGTTKTIEASSRYIEVCENTRRLKVSLCVRILMLAALRDTSTTSSIEIVAARLVEPDFLEAVQQIDQAIEQPVVPSGGFALPGREFVALGVEDHRRHAQDRHAQQERQHRQISDVDADEDDQNDALPGEGDHVGRLRQRGGVLVDRGDDLRAADGVERDEFGAPHQIHQAHAQTMDDGFDFDRGGDEDVVLGLDEEIKRNDEQRRCPDADRARAGLLRAGIDRRQNGRVAHSAETGHDDQPLQRALHFAANNMEE